MYITMYIDSFFLFGTSYKNRPKVTVINSNFPQNGINLKIYSFFLFQVSNTFLWGKIWSKNVFYVEYRSKIDFNSFIINLDKFPLKFV